MKKKLLLILILSQITIASAFAADISIDPSQTILGARELALGRSGIAEVREPWNLIINPAGLASMKYPKFSATSRRVVFGETQYINVNGAIPTDWGTFGLGVININAADSIQTKRDGETNRIIPNPSLEALAYNNNLFILSYSKDDFVKKDIAIGANLKYHQQSFSGGQAINAQAIGFDLGSQFQVNPLLRVGANYQNIFSSGLKWNSTGEADNSLGGLLKIGSKINLLGDKGTALRSFKDQKVVGYLDIPLINSSLTQNSYNLGFEWLVSKDINLRTGYNSNFGLSYGVGLQNEGFRFDYAYAPSPYGSGNNPHYFTLSYMGELVKRVSRKLINEFFAIKFDKYKDKAITTEENIKFEGKASYKKVFKQTTSWIVPSISQKDEFTTVTEEAYIDKLELNNHKIKVNANATFEIEEKLYVGRNLFYFAGKLPKQGSTWEAVRILRIIPFTDVSEDFWAFRPIALNSTLGIIKGYPGNLFKPNKGITRAELVALLLRTSGISKESIGYIENPFKDLKESFWATAFVLKGVEQKLVQGYPDQTFKPNRVLSRAEGITIISRFAKLKEINRTVFPDLKEGYWANKYIAAAKDAGLLKYLAEKDFVPNQAFTRAEAAEVLYLTKGIQEKADYFWETGKISKATTLEAASKPTNSPSNDKNKKQ